MFTKLHFNLKYPDCKNYKLYLYTANNIYHPNPRIYINYYLYNILKITTHCKITRELKLNSYCKFSLEKSYAH